VLAIDPDTTDHDNAPTPSLVVEVLSGFTRRRDREQKRAIYMDAGISAYWMSDPVARTLTPVRKGQRDVVAGDEDVWRPSAAPASLTIRVSDLLRDT
jgi:Uma2 family endonuclease